MAYSNYSHTMSLPGYSSHLPRNYDAYWMLEEQEQANSLHNARMDEISDDVYVEKMEAILSAPPFIGVPPEPSALLNGVYIGTQAQGENMELLRRLRFTHVLNCAGLRTTHGIKVKRVLQYRENGIVYDELPLEDRESFEIWPYFDTAQAFIENGSLIGKVLVCDAGVSRSGAIAVAYLMRRGRTLLKATQEVKDLRRVVLCNHGYVKQLVKFARVLGRLDPDPRTVLTPKYGRALDRARIMSAHIPIVL